MCFITSLVLLSTVALVDFHYKLCEFGSILLNVRGSYKDENKRRVYGSKHAR